MNVGKIRFSFELRAHQGPFDEDTESSRVRRQRTGAVLPQKIPNRRLVVIAVEDGLKDTEPLLHRHRCRHLICPASSLTVSSSGIPDSWDSNKLV